MKSINVYKHYSLSNSSYSNKIPIIMTMCVCVNVLISC